MITRDRHKCFQFFITCKRTNNANNTTHYVKLHKKKTREFQTQLLHYFSKSDNKSNHHQPDSALEEAIRAWECSNSHHVATLEWRPANKSHMTLRKDAHGPNHQTITHYPAWTNVSSRAQWCEPTDSKTTHTEHWNLLTMATSQIEPTLRPYDMYLPPINSRRLQDSPLNNLEEVKAWMRCHRPGDIDNRASGNLEYLYEMNTPSPDCLLYLLQLCQSNRTAQLRKPLLEQQDLLRMPGSF